MKRRGKNLTKLNKVINKLKNNEKLNIKYKDHKLTNSRNYYNVRECHIESDWLLIYQIDKNILKLLRTGTHSDLF